MPHSAPPRLPPSVQVHDLPRPLAPSPPAPQAKFLTYYTKNGILPTDPFETLDQEGVGELVRIAVERGRKTRPDIELGICGEHGGDPASIDFFNKVGVRGLKLQVLVFLGFIAIKNVSLFHTCMDSRTWVGARGWVGGWLRPSAYSIHTWIAVHGWPCAVQCQAHGCPCTKKGLHSIWPVQWVVLVEVFSGGAMVGGGKELAVDLVGA